MTFPLVDLHDPSHHQQSAISHLVISLKQDNQNWAHIWSDWRMFSDQMQYILAQRPDLKNSRICRILGQSDSIWCWLTPTSMMLSDMSSDMLCDNIMSSDQLTQ